MSITKKWQVIEHIGYGSFADVYRIKMDNQQYALKKIRPEILKNESKRNVIQRQIQIMQSINHPKIIKFYKVIQEEDQINILLQYASKGSLHQQILQFGRLSQKKTKQYVQDIIQALQYLHYRKIPILHRDIKPQNLLITQNGICKLADFGSANLLDGQRYSYVGTEQFMAPEMKQCNGHGIPYDLWCLGVLIFEMLTGSLTNNLKQIPIYVSRGAEDVIKRLLIQNPDERMTLQELKEHVWMGGLQKHKINNVNEKQKASPKIKMSQKINQKLKVLQLYKSYRKTQQQENQSSTIVKETNRIQFQSNYYIQLLKQRQKLKQQIKLNNNIIIKKQMNIMRQKPLLLQQIKRYKSKIQEYQTKILKIKNKMPKMEDKLKHNIKLFLKKTEQIQQYLSQRSNRIKQQINNNPQFNLIIQDIPSSDYIKKYYLQMLINKRDSLSNLITSKKLSKQINDMTQISKHFQKQQIPIKKQQKLSLDYTNQKTKTL